MRPARPCSRPLCPALVFDRDSRCLAHRRERWREYEQRRPDRSEMAAFYASARWRKARAEALAACGGVCVECRRRPASPVDHRIPVRDGGDPYDLSNLAPLCVSCHNAKTARENHAKGRW